MKFREYNFSINLKNKIVIGVDEVGVGDYFGPLVSAAANIPVKNRQEVLDLGIQDSKKMSDKKIKIIVPKLKKIVNYAIHHLSPSGYNKLSRSYNGNFLKMFTHLSSINQLEKKINHVDYIFIDKYSTTNSIIKYYDNLLKVNNWANFTEPKGEILLAFKAESINLEVAVASVLARDYFLSYMDKMNHNYNVQFPFGAGQKTKEFAYKFFKKNPQIKKEELCKLTFKMDLEEKNELKLTNLFDK